MSGFCPVALRQRREWVTGDPELIAEFDGRWYLMSGERERAIFAAAPEQYVPALGGDCIVAFVDDGKRAPGRIDQGVIYDDRLFFFSTIDAKAKFNQDSTTYADADLYRGGVCPVTLAATGLAMPGDPATATTFANGLRFRFVDAASRRAFLQDPQRFLGAMKLESPSSGKGMPKSRARGEATAKSDDQAAEFPQASATSGAGARKDGEGAASPGQATNHAVGGAAEPILNGYCPVSVWTKPGNPWVRGQYSQRWEYEGMVFLPAGRTEREMLDADPARYIPALGGACAVTFAETGKRVKGSVYHTYVDRHTKLLYLCVDAEAKKQLVEEGERLRDVRRLEAAGLVEKAKTILEEHPVKYLFVDYAAGGLCVVTRRDENKDVPGLPQTSAWFEGRRYLFAGEEQKKKFLADPEKYSAPVGEKPESGETPEDRAEK